MIPLLYAAVVLGQTAQATFMKLNSKTKSDDVVRFTFVKSLSAVLLFLVLLYLHFLHFCQMLLLLLLFSSMYDMQLQ